MQSTKKRSWVRLLIKLFCLVAFMIAVSVPLFTTVDYCRHVDRFLFFVKTGDSVGAQNELKKLHYFYVLSGKWKIQWLADKYLFGDAPFYEIASSYLIEDWDAVVEKHDLKNKLDDPRSYPYGNAKFRQAQAEYRATRRIEAPLNLVTTEISKDFERDLRNCLKSSAYLKCFDRVWNYDLASNKNDAKEALKQPQMPPEYILGPLKDDEKNGPGKPPGEWPSGTKLDEEKPGGSGSRKRP